MSWTEILAFILGAAVPSALLWQKTRECQGLLDELLRKEGRRPLQRNVPRLKDRSQTSKSDDAGSENAPLVQTINPSPIDRMMADAIAKNTKEFGQSSIDKNPILE